MCCTASRSRFAGWLFLLVLLGLVVPRPTKAADPDKSKLAGIRERMQQFVDDKIIAGAVTLIGTHDQILSLESVGSQVLESNLPTRPDTLFRIASMTKPITAIGIMILVDEGKLSVDDPVEKHLP
ncbi:MAG TPA: serine hydrolase domain-containing protein, partial [Gemmataceae bacterium]|nr:serine hydrolase domain-containing protein [Gemmataceae bacterium]